MGRSVNTSHDAGQGARNREGLYLLLKVLNEHSPGVLEDLNRVAHFATATAESLGLSEYEVERVEIAGRLHNVGNLAIPQTVLNKPGPLFNEEWEIMRTHAEIGGRILASAPSLADVAGSCAPTTSATTVKATPTASPARPYPSARASSPCPPRSSR